MLGILAVLAAIFVALGFVAFVAKLVLTLVLLPLHVAFFLVKGLLLLVFAVPVVLALAGVAAVAVPIAIALLGLPILLVVGGIVLLVKLLS
jgi:hypothetical protein